MLFGDLNKSIPDTQDHRRTGGWVEGHITLYRDAKTLSQDVGELAEMFMIGLNVHVNFYIDWQF